MEALRFYNEKEVDSFLEEKEIDCSTLSFKEKVETLNNIHGLDNSKSKFVVFTTNNNENLTAYVHFE